MESLGAGEVVSPILVPGFGQYGRGDFTEITGIDAARSLMLGRDVTTVVELTRFEGVLNGVVPGLAVLAVVDVAFGAVAVYLLSRASSSDLK